MSQMSSNQRAELKKVAKEIGKEAKRKEAIDLPPMAEYDDCEGVYSEYLRYKEQYDFRDVDPERYDDFIAAEAIIFAASALSKHGCGELVEDLMRLSLNKLRKFEADSLANRAKDARKPVPLTEQQRKMAEAYMLYQKPASQGGYGLSQSEAARQVSENFNQKRTKETLNAWAKKTNHT